MVISQLNSDLTATVKNECCTIWCSSKKLYCSCWVCYLLSSMLKSFGYSASNFRVQKFSLLTNHWVTFSLDLEVFVNWSIMTNFTCLLKLWLFYWKCLQIIIALTFFTSFWWIFSLILKLVSPFATCCLLHKMRSIKYITIVFIRIYMYLQCRLCFNWFEPM